LIWKRGSWRAGMTRVPASRRVLEPLKRLSTLSG
jgi:hypothetical protein